MGISPSTLRGYTRRRAAQETEPIQPERTIRQPAAKGGQPDLYNLQGVLQLGIVSELVRGGFEAVEAFEMAAVLFNPSIEKQTGGCYHPDYGHTLLIVSRERRIVFYPKEFEHFSKDEDAGTAVWLFKEPDFRDWYHQAFDFAVSTQIINVTLLERRLFGKLGVKGNSWDGTETWEPNS